MTFKVISGVNIKTAMGVTTLRPGQVVKLSASSATALIEAGRIVPVFEPVDDLNERMCIQSENCKPGQIEPYVTSFGTLIIPFNSDKKYHYWKPGGQSLCDTLRELGRCDLIEKYKSIYSN